MKLGFLISAVVFSSFIASKPLPCLAQSATIPQDWAEIASPTTSVVDQLQDTFVKVAAKVKPSVVTVYAERLPEATPAQQDDNGSNKPDETPSPSKSPAMPSVPDDSEASLGSGMVIDNEGHILTNYHVVKDAVVIRVVTDTSADSPARPIAKLIGYDEESDLAVLQVSNFASLQPVQFGDSNALRVGEWVLAIGAPFDQAQTVTAGVISAKSRHLTKDGQLSLQDYLQTDASINPGNSGGPLIDMQGKVIGVNTAILSPSRYSVGIGFAVPSATITRLLPKLLLGQHVERGFLGIRYLPISPEVAAAFGVTGGMQIGALARQEGKPYGPAFDAGLRQGDIIVAVNGQLVSTSELFRGFVSALTPGTVVQLDVIRPMQQGLQRRTFEITLSDRSDDAQPSYISAAPSVLNLSQFGLQVENTKELTASQRVLLGQTPSALGQGENNVIITYVRPGGTADDAQLRQGEIIEKINVMRRSVTGEESLGAWQTITDKDQLIKLAQNLPAQTKVLVQLQDKQGIMLYKMLLFATPLAEG
jgi:serine protease Do